MDAPPDSLQAMAAAANLPVPTVRYWAHTHGHLLGIRRTPTGEWHFTDIAVAFFHTLSAMAAPESPVVEDAPADISCDELPADVFHDEFEHTELRLDELHHTDGRLDGVGDEDDRLHDIAIHMSHLWEETKQMQRLLSRIIELLTPKEGMSPESDATPPIEALSTDMNDHTGDVSPAVGPWRPRRL